LQKEGKPVTAIEISSNGRLAVTARSGVLRGEPNLSLWSMPAGRLEGEFRGRLASEHEDVADGYVPAVSTVQSTAISANGEFVLTGHDDGAVVLWSRNSWRPSEVFQDHKGAVRSVRFSPDGRAALSGSADKTAILWDVETGRNLQRFSGHMDDVTSVAFLPQGDFALTGSADGSICIWRLSFANANQPSNLGRLDFENRSFGDELVRLYSFERSTGWLAVTPDGHFDGSKNVNEYLGYVKLSNFDYSPLQPYREKFHYPGLLDMVLMEDK